MTLGTKAKGCPEVPGRLPTSGAPASTSPGRNPESCDNRDSLALGGQTLSECLTQFAVQTIDSLLCTEWEVIPHNGDTAFLYNWMGFGGGRGLLPYLWFLLLPLNTVPLSFYYNKKFTWVSRLTINKYILF